ncbi:MAG TPA: SusC/RagA family TonB-linked outer membrane protein, partial [Chryseosolibacter sp.]
MFTVSGSVTGADGESMPGVNVVEKGTANGTTTDFDGKYTINVDDENAVLVFSFIGYSTQEIVVNGRSQIGVELTEDAQSLDEVVVVGYGTQKKVNVTGAITAIKTEELNNITSTNLSNTLAGRAPGVNITGTSGLAGATSSIRIRGSFGEPLFVIDGIVRDKEAFDALQPNEVDQLSFLKDAATASIYGSRAGNGVVLVTTKQGTVQKPTFGFLASYTTSSPTQTLLSDQYTATDELIYQNRVAEFLGTTPPNGPEEFEYFRNRSYNVNDFIWRNPTAQNYALSVNGGTEKLTYYSLLSYMGEEGSYKGLDYGKVNLRTNVTAKITDAIKFNMNVSANQQNHDRFYWPFTGDDDYDVSDLYRVTFNWPKVYPFYLEADGTPANYITDYPVQTPMGSWQAWSVIDQIVGDRYINTRKRQLNTILALDIDLDKIIPGLSTRVSANYLAEDYMRKWYLTFQKNYVFNQADPDGNRFLPGAPDPNKTNTFTFSRNQPFLAYNVSTQWSYQVNAFLNYDRTFGKHGVNAMLVYEQAEEGGYGAYARAEDPITSYDQDFVYSMDSERRFGNGFEKIGARQSLIGRANYNFTDRYIAEFSFRYDGNTLFPKHKRWGFFPSLSAAWRISEEAFMNGTAGWLDELKFRASYGTTGNDLDMFGEELVPFSFLPVYVNSGSYIFGNDLYQAIAPGATPNPNLTWATSTTYNAGLDIAVIDGRLSGSIDVFSKKE